jgi:hypothetical protein
MRVWEENRTILTGAGIAALAVLAVYFSFVSWFSAKTGEIRAGYEDLGRKLDSAREGHFDLAGATNALSRSNRDLSQEVENLKKRVEIEFHPWVTIPPDRLGDPGAYFYFQHARQREELNIECMKANPSVKLSDADIGFPVVGKGHVKDKDAPENLRRLSIVRRLVLLLMKAGVTEIVSINPSAPVWTGPEGYPQFIREYPVSIHVRTRLDPLMKFLHSVRRPGEFFLVVREFDVGAFDPYEGKRGARSDADESQLSVTISAAGMRFATEEERPQTPKKAPSLPAGKVEPRYEPGQAIGH